MSGMLVLWSRVGRAVRQAFQPDKFVRLESLTYSSAHPTLKKQAAPLRLLGWGGPQVNRPMSATTGQLHRSFRVSYQLWVITGTTRFTRCRTCRGTCRCRLGGPISPQLPRIAQLAAAGKHRHQQEEQHPQPLHPTGLLSWRVSSIVTSWRFTEIVRHDGGMQLNSRRRAAFFAVEAHPRGKMLGLGKL